MGKLSPELLFALVICFICLPLLLADTSCPVVPGTTCSDVDDKDIMKCCLKNYKLGFETLPQEHIPKSQDPPSCKLDLGLAKCLSQSRCYANVTNALRILILNQLVFTKRVGICERNQFDQLLTEARDANVKGLGEVEEMKGMKDKEANYSGCAFTVYAICGGRFKEELRKYSGFNPRQLCGVFISEGDCTTTVANESNCISPVLTRFKQNSNKAASVVLPALCSLPSSK